MEIAVYECGGKILKTTNLAKKIKKLGNGMRILHSELFEGDLKEAEALLDRWIRSNLSKADEGVDAVDLHYFRIPDGWIVTMYKDVSRMGHTEAIEVSKEEYKRSMI